MPADEHVKPLNVPPAWTPARGGNKGEAEAKDPGDRIEVANEMARVQPRRAGLMGPSITHGALILSWRSATMVFQ